MLRSLSWLVVLLLAVWFCARASSAGVAQAQEQFDAALSARGRKLLDMQGCTACHSLDGSISAGPTFYGRFGSKVPVMVGDQQEQRLFDATYVKESIADPGAVVSQGFSRGVMPRFTLTGEQLKAITYTIEHLADEPLRTPRATPERPSPMRWLALFVLWFVGAHIILSSTPVRTQLVKWLGERPFQLLYSLVVTGGLLGTVWAYSEAPYSELWPPLVWTRYVPLLLMPLSAFFIVAGMTTRGPTRVGVSPSQAQAVGVLRITRHPQLWGTVLFSVSHLPPNGDAAALLFFGAFGALAVLGMVHIEHRRKAVHGPAWQQFCETTSIMPFVAILERRNQLVWREIGLWRVLAALGLYAALLLSHGYLFGASPFP
jgi:uncharacterized membrane protein